MLAKLFKLNQTPDRLSAITISLKQIIYNPLISFVIIIMMTLSIFLATTFYVLWQNVGALNEKWNESAEISLYLKKKVGTKESKALVEKLQSNPLITKIALIQPDEGIKTFTESTTLKTLLSSFKENPLPNVIVVHPQVNVLTKNKALAFIEELKSFSEVEIVKADLAWIERGYNWLNLWNNLSLVFIFLFSINMLLVIGSISYTMAKIFALKKDTSKVILSYQFAWFGLISGLLSLLWTRVISTILQNHGILLQGLAISWIIFVVLISVFLSYFSAKIGANS